MSHTARAIIAQLIQVVDILHSHGIVHAGTRLHILWLQEYEELSMT